VLGSRFFSPLLRGRPAEIYGQRDVPHSYAYLSDFAATMATVGTGGDDVWGRSWIAPHDTARTVDELETELRRLTHGARVKIMSKGMLGAAGLFVPAARETVEMLYEFEHPFVVDSSETETRFGIQATEMSRGLGVTLEWYRESIQEGRDSERTPHARTAQEAYPGRG